MVTQSSLPDLPHVVLLVDPLGGDRGLLLDSCLLCEQLDKKLGVRSVKTQHTAPLLLLSNWVKPDVVLALDLQAVPGPGQRLGFLLAIFR